MWQTHIRKITIKSKIIDSFFKRKTYDEDEKNIYTSTKLEKLHENPRSEENEKTTL